MAIASMKGFEELVLLEVLFPAPPVAVAVEFELVLVYPPEVPLFWLVVLDPDELVLDELALPVVELEAVVELGIVTGR